MGTQVDRVEIDYTVRGRYFRVPALGSEKTWHGMKLRITEVKVYEIGQEVYTVTVHGIVIGGDRNSDNLVLDLADGYSETGGAAPMPRTGGYGRVDQLPAVHDSQEDRF